jgi:hypothetical protein
MIESKDDYSHLKRCYSIQIIKLIQLMKRNSKIWKKKTLKICATEKMYKI